jgi:hypothetical protein
MGGICLPPDCGGDQGLPQHALIIIVIVGGGGGSSVGRVDGLVVVVSVSVVVIIATVVVTVAVIQQILAVGHDRSIRRPPLTPTPAAPTANPRADAGVPPSLIVQNILLRLWLSSDAFDTMVPAYNPMMPPPPSPPTLLPALPLAKGPHK